MTDLWVTAPVTVVSEDDWLTTQAQRRGWELADSVEDWSAPEG